MKTAILISGHARSFARCLPNQAWFVYRHFGECDFFCSFQPDEDAGSAELLRERFPNARVEINLTPQPDMQPFMSDLVEKHLCPGTWESGSHYMHEPYAISVSPLAVLGQLWRLQRCWDLFADPTKEGFAERYDTIIRCRPDLWFHGNCDWREPVGSDIAATPSWGRFGGVNDRFAILGGQAAHAYFTTFSQIGAHLQVGCPLHPESLIATSLERAQCEVYDYLAVEFSKMGRDGRIERWPEITAGDIAHAASLR